MPYRSASGISLCSLRLEAICPMCRAAFFGSFAEHQRLFLIFHCYEIKRNSSRD